MLFVPRLEAPAKNNKYYYDKKYNSRLGGKYDIPNCTTYVLCRWYEILDKKSNLHTGDAENFWSKKDGYERGQVPRLGAVMCWKKGIAGNSEDGAGHVAITEVIKTDGTVNASNSAFKGSEFYMREYKPPYNFTGKDGIEYIFQGFIYLPVQLDLPEEKPAVEPENGQKQGIFKKGDIVKIISAGNGASNGKANKSYGIGWERSILNVYPDKAYPYQVGNKEGTTGFYKEDALQPIKTSSTINVGDTVIVNGCGSASSTGDGRKTVNFTNRKMKVIAILKNAKMPYALNIFNQGTPNNFKDVSGWFNATSVKK